MALFWREYQGSWALLSETVTGKLGLELEAMQALGLAYRGCNEVGRSRQHLEKSDYLSSNPLTSSSPVILT